MNLKKLLYTTVLALAIVACSKDDGPANSAPTIGAKTFTASEDIGDTKVIGTVTATDKDGDELSFSIGKNSGTLFEITKDGALSLATGKGLDFETAASHAITVAVSDGSASASATITINVTDVDDGQNSAPVVVTEGFEVPEDITGPIGTIEATDADNDPLEFGIKTDESGLFELSQAGELTLAEGKALDFETAQSHQILISVTDGIATTEATITVTVTDVDESLAKDPNSFVTTWKTDADMETIAIYLDTDYAYNFTVDWGDGTVETVTSNENLEHTYQTAKTYTVAMQGDIPYIKMNSEKLMSIEQWGNNQWKSMSGSFINATNMVYNATDKPDLSQVEDMGYMFAYAENFNGDIGDWDVSNVTNMPSLFEEAEAFNQNISAWNVSNVTNMLSLFEGAEAFNQNISAWDVSKVEFISRMFEGATAFDQPLDWGTKTSNVTNMGSMFQGATAFNQDISGWDVSKVTDMRLMFYGTDEFDQNIGAWDVSNVTNMSGMFNNAVAFNQDIGGWNVSNVKEMDHMFYGATAFNQNISAWNISKVTTMLSMFNGADLFNQPLEWGTKTSNVLDMGRMFQDAPSFNQDISGWDVSNVINMTYMFKGASSFNQDIGDWDVSKVTDMSSMFREATMFNQNIGNWNVGLVKSMIQMFSGASAFDQNLGSWNISSVTLMPEMFDNSNMSAFNYGETLIGWSSLINIPQAIELGASGLFWCTNNAQVITARDILATNNGWSFIGDNGQICL